MEHQKQNSKVLRETTFFGISQVTGLLQPFEGMYVQASTLPEAIHAARAAKLDYLQFTGRFFNSFEETLMNEGFYEKLTDPRNIVKNMNIDDFYEWLDLAVEKQDLLKAREEFSKHNELSEHVKVIDGHIKNKYEKKDDKETQDGETDS